MPIGRDPLLRRIWQSVVLRGPVVPRTDRDRAFVTVHTLLLHLRPVKVPARTIRFTHTFGLGGSSLVLITILARHRHPHDARVPAGAGPGATTRS